MRWQQKKIRSNRRGGLCQRSKYLLSGRRGRGRDSEEEVRRPKGLSSPWVGSRDTRHCHVRTRERPWSDPILLFQFLHGPKLRTSHDFLTLCPNPVRVLVQIHLYDGARRTRIFPAPEIAYGP